MLVGQQRTERREIDRTPISEHPDEQHRQRVDDEERQQKP